MSSNRQVQLWSESFGNKQDPALLLIMGAMNQSILWPTPFCETLAQAGFYVIRYDHRDTGRSDGVDYLAHPYDLTDLKNDALTVLADHGFAQAVVVGLSMGGYIAQLMAIENPQTVTSLILLSTSANQQPYMQSTMGELLTDRSLPPPVPNFLAYITASAELPRSDDELLQLIVEGWRVTYGGDRSFPEVEITDAIKQSQLRAKAGGVAMNHAAATARSLDRLNTVGKIIAPTLVIHGAYDPCFPLPHGQYLANHIPNSVLEVFEMGHSFQWSWDKEIARSILKFLHSLN